MGQHKITSIVINPSGERAATLDSAGALMLWDARTCTPLGPIPRPRASKGTARLLAWHAGEGALLLVEGGTVVLRDPITGAVLRRWKAHDKPAVMAVASGDGGRVVTATQNSVRLWDVATGQCVGTRASRYPSPPKAAALGTHPTRCNLLWLDFVDSIDFADPWVRSSSSNYYNKAASLDVEPERQWFVIGGQHGNLRCWGLDGGIAAQVQEAHTVPVATVLVLPGSSAVLSAASDGLVKRWSVEAQMQLQSTWIAPQPVTAAARTPSGSVLLGGQRGLLFRAPD
jgi:WD40 repeat protein